MIGEIARKFVEIGRIERESRARGFRVIVAEVREGLEKGESWRAKRTAQAVVREAFANTPMYFRALEEFCVRIRARRG